MSVNVSKKTMPVIINGVMVSRPIEYVEHPGLGWIARPVVESGLIECTCMNDEIPRYVTEYPVTD